MNRALHFALSVLATASLAFGHVAQHPSIHDTISGIIDRLQRELPMDSLAEVSEDRVLSFLTDTERRILSSEYVTFTVDQPVTLTIFLETGHRPPFWFADHGFTRTDDEMVTYSKSFEGWSAEFDAGYIGLGVHNLTGSGRHYVIVVSPRSGDEPVELTNIYPGYYRPDSFTLGSVVYRDSDYYKLERVPERLDGDVFLAGMRSRTKETVTTGIFRLTQYPASTKPEQIALTWSEDPRTSQTVQWRTSADVSDGVVRYRRVGTTDEFTEVIARRNVLRDRNLLNDPVNARFDVVLRNLTSNTRYEYRVGSPSLGTWSTLAEFTTAPDGSEPFSFMYLGDPQSGLDTWGELVRRAYIKHPETRFWVVAGDLVNRGNQRDDWDSFFMNADPVFREQPIVPALGNHEYQGKHGPWMYVRLFTLPQNGPEKIQPEYGYALRYSNALFLVLDSNQPAETQVDWIDEQFATTDAVWKFVVFHHPAYSSHPRSDNVEIREIWGAIFERYHVDLALQGHDHAYLRTDPMRDGEPVGSPAEGTIYIVSVSGTKMYPQGEHPYAEVGFTNTSMYQLLDISIDDNRLRYRAYDRDGTIRDEFTIEK